MRKDIDEIKKETFDNHSKLHNKSGLGRDFLGWVNLPSSISKEDINNIKAAAEKISAIAEYVVVVGIGGSYLGARAIIDALSDSFGHLKTERKHPIILYAGQNISEDYTHDLLDLLKDKSFAIVVISKSGTTTEPAIAFRLLKNLMEKKYKQD
jgi:glucose-6-phosphate isomerase